MTTSIITDRMFLALWDETVGKGRKVAPLDLASDFGNDLADAAEFYARTYEGDFPFMISMHDKLARNGGLTDAMMCGILNCFLAEVRREARTAKKVSTSVSAPVQNPTSALNLASVPDGIYTVFNDEDHLTLRIRAWKGRDGLRVISYLSGPMNETDYAGFATIAADGAVQVWSRFYGADRLLDGVKTLSGANLTESRFAYAQMSGRCAICGRTLTVPASLNAGVGPECLKKLG